MRNMAPQLHLEASNTEVAQFSIVKDEIRILKLNHIHRVVEHHRVGSLYIAEKDYFLENGFPFKYFLPLNFISLSKSHLGHVIRVGANLELASLIKYSWKVSERNKNKYRGNLKTTSVRNGRFGNNHPFCGYIFSFSHKKSVQLNFNHNM